MLLLIEHVVISASAQRMLQHLTTKATPRGALLAQTQHRWLHRPKSESACRAITAADSVLFYGLPQAPRFRSAPGSCATNV